MIFIDGFEKDITRMRKMYHKTTSIMFEEFKAIYKQQKFPLIFLGHKTLSESLEFTEQVILYCKNMWLDSQSLNDQIFGLYMMAALCYTQPFQDGVNVRLVAKKDKEKILLFLENVSKKDCKDAIYIFHKLICDGMVEICWTQHQYAMEKSYRKYFPNKWRCLPDLTKDVPMKEMKSYLTQREGGVKLLKGSLKTVTEWREVIEETNNSKLGLVLNIDLKKELTKAFTTVNQAREVKTGERKRRSASVEKPSKSRKRNKSTKQEDEYFAWYANEQSTSYSGQTNMNVDSELLLQATDIDEIFKQEVKEETEWDDEEQEGDDHTIMFPLYKEEGNGAAGDVEMVEDEGAAFHNDPANQSVIFVDEVGKCDVISLNDSIILFEENQNEAAVDQGIQEGHSVRESGGNENVDSCTFSVMQDALSYILKECNLE